MLKVPFLYPVFKKNPALEAESPFVVFTVKIQSAWLHSYTWLTIITMYPNKHLESKEKSVFSSCAQLSLLYRPESFSLLIDNCAFPWLFEIIMWKISANDACLIWALPEILHICWPLCEKSESTLKVNQQFLAEPKTLTPVTVSDIFNGQRKCEPFELFPVL